MNELEKYRKEIDEIDNAMLELFHRRMEIIPYVGAYKRSHALPLEDKTRELSILSERARGNADDTEFLQTVMNISKAKQRSFFNVYIIGMPYSGKSTFLHRISKQSKRDCIDMDSIIEQQAGMSVSEIFETEGEEAFRKAETELLRIIAGEGSLIVATGGGVVKSDENRILMKNSGVCVLCDRPLEDIKAAYEQDEAGSRPLIKNIEDLEVLYFERFKLYRELADLIVNPSRCDAVSRVKDLIDSQ